MSHYSEVIQDDPLAFWRMSDAPFQETISRYNLCPNPSLEVDAAGFSTQRYGSSVNHSNFAGSRQTDGGWNGTAYYRATALTNWSFKSWITMPECDVTVGKAYVLSFYVRVNRTMNVGANVESVRSNGSVVGLVVGTVQEVPAGQWVRMSQIHTVPATGVRARALAVVDSLQSGDTIEVDGLLYEETTELKDWFDGSSANAVWLGTAGASSSRHDTVFTRRYMIDEKGVYRGDYSATGVTYGVTDFPEGGDGASQFTSAGSAVVVGGNDIWNFGTVPPGQWTIEFLARFDDDAGGTVLSTNRWKIATDCTREIGYMPAGSTSGWSAPAQWQDNAWHHYVFTFLDGLLTIYVDGEDILSYADTNHDTVGSGALNFAGGTAVTLDEVAIYPRALDDGRVSAHYIGLSQAFAEVVTSVYVEPRQPVLVLPHEGVVTEQMTVTIQYSGGGVATPVNVVWSTSDTDVASISPTGLVTALGEGSTAITATLPDLDMSAFTGISVLPPDPLPGETREVYSGDPVRPIFTDDGHIVATTEEYWEVDSGRLIQGDWVYDTPVSLATLAFNISTLAGREGIPVGDTENIRISTRAGRRWIPKTPDQKVLSLAMWVQGTNDDGSLPQDVHLRTKFWDNYNKLKQLFAVWDRQILLRRRVPTRYGIMTMQTWVEPVSSMDLNPTGPMRAAFTIDLAMNDPFWHGEQEKSGEVVVQYPGGLRRYPRSYPLAYGSAGRFGETGIYTLVNNGTHEARLIAEIHGPVTNPSFLNMDTNERFRLVNDVSLDEGDIVDVNFYDRTIVLRGTGSRYWWLDRTTDWLHARPGSQRFQFSHEGFEDTGFVVWRWEPSYL